MHESPVFYHDSVILSAYQVGNILTLSYTLQNSGNLSSFTNSLKYRSYFRACHHLTPSRADVQTLVCIEETKETHNNQMLDPNLR